MIQIVSDCDPNLLGPKQSQIQDITNKVLESYKIHNAEISFIFGGDELLRRLKKKFFNKNLFTDVIAFRLNDYKNDQIEGEIYISLDRAKENASVYKEPYEKEVSRLIIHACLHLIGFNDETEKQKIKMTELENKFLNNIEWSKIF